MTNREKLNGMAMYDLLYAMNKQLLSNGPMGSVSSCIMDALAYQNYNCDPGGDFDCCAECIQRYLNEEGK